MLRDKLLSWKSDVYFELIKKYPNEKLLGILQSIDAQLAEVDGHKAGVPENDGREEARMWDDEAIIKTSITVLKKDVKQPAYGNEIVRALRKRNIALPENERSATNKVTGLFSRRSHLFKRVPGPTEKAASKWQLANQG